MPLCQLLRLTAIMQATSLNQHMQGLNITGSSGSGGAVKVFEENETVVADGDDEMDEEEDINFVDDGSCLDAETNKFDQIVGALEDIILDPAFEDEREVFCRNNCHHFEESDENKLEYTDIFQKYTELIETSIENKLRAAVAGFDMEEFLRLLDAHKDELMSDVFDLLTSLGDFEAFKEVMLSYKREQQAGNLLQISCTAMKIHNEDQEDGEERPDLDFGLQVSSFEFKRR